MKKRVLSVLLVMCMVLSMLPATALAVTGEVVASGYCGGEGDGTNLTWTLYEDGELVVEGTGAMADYDNVGVGPWYSDHESITKVTIGDSVTTVGADAFAECINLTTVAIGDGVTIIGADSFALCFSLTTVTIGDSVTTIGVEAFAGCDSLTSVTIPASVTTIEAEAFELCDVLTAVTFEGNMPTTVGSDLFAQCSADLTIYYHEGTSGWPATGIWQGLPLVMIPAEVYEITVGTATNGVVSVDKTTAKAGETVSVIAEPEVGYELEYILVDGAAIDGNTFTATGNHTVTATFAEVGPKREVIASGYCGGEGDGTNLTWTLYEDGELVIEGTGAMADYEDAFDKPWFGQTISKVTIGQGVTSIGFAAFENENIESIEIANGVINIGAKAFYQCYELKSIDIPDSVESIGERCFFNSRIEEITIGSGVNCIGEWAFANARNLKKITVSPQNNYFSNDDFGALFNKEKTVIFRYPEGRTDTFYEIPGTVREIADPAFRDAHYLTNIVIPDSVEIVGDYAFARCSMLEDVRLCGKVTSIGDTAFYECENLKSITIPDSVTSIGSVAFGDCTSLSSVEFMGDAPTVGEDAFVACNANLTIYYHEGTTGWTESEHYDVDAGTWCGAPLVMIPAEMYEITVGTVTNGMVVVDRTTAKAGDTVTVNATPIDGYVLKEILVNGNVITGSTFIVSDDCEVTAIFEEVEPERDITASGYCGGEGDGTNLTWTLYKDGELIISGIGKMADYANYTKTPWYEKRSSIKTITIEDGVTTIGDNAFHICWSLTQLNIANSVTSIGESAFHNCYSLKSVEIPEGVTTIGEGAFEMCFGLTTVSLPDSLTTIEDIAFMSCDKLESVHIPAGVTSIGRAFDGCAGLMEITVDAANTAYSSKDGVLFNKAQTVLVCCPGKKSGHYTIPDGVTTIREHAFSNCTKLTSVTIPNGVATIGDYAFWCVGLNQITIPTSVTTIGFSAFYCSGLTRMEFLGNAPSAVDANAVRCDNLTIYYHEGTTGWMDSEHYDAQASTWCGRPLVKILASGYCGGEGDGTNLTWTMYEDGELVIEGTGAMGNWAYFATGMGDDILPWEDHWYLAKKVTIHDGVTTIGSGAFCRNDNLTTVTIPDSVTAIGDGAFYDCDGLSEVDIPDSVTSIGTAAFYDCSALESVQLPDGVTTLSEMVFAACENLADVAIPADVRVIEREAFSGCTNLLAVTIPADVTTIGEYAFSDCTDLNVLVFEGDAPTFYEHREDDTSRFSIYCFTEKNGWTDSEHYDAETGMWYGNPLVELFNRRGLAVWLAETYLDPDMQIDLSKSYFTDVDINDKNFREIMLCSYLGLFAGSDGKFNPDGTVNRAQMATVLVKVYNGSDFNADSFKGQSHFSDTADFEGGWAEGYINWAFQQGLMKAYDEMAADFFMPNITTRKIDIMTVGMKHVVMAGQAENGTVSIDKTYGAEGETVTVTAVPDTGYQLRKILVSGKAIDGNTFTITGNHFVTALFGIVASITTDSVADATQHVPYSAMIQTDHWDDSMSFELASGKLPAGLKLKKSGELYGVPSQAGTFTFTVNAVYSDDGTVVDSKAFSLTVLEDIPENIEDVNKGPEGYEVKEHIGTPVTNDQGETHYEIDVKKVKEEDLVFVSEGEFDEFVDVYLDGRKLIRDEEYTVEEGSTKITIRAQTFKSAGNGQHVIAAEFRAGETLKKTAQSVTVSGVKTASLGGGSVSTVKQYKITVEPNANGTITCTRTTAREKEVVVITVQPAAGYIVKSVSAGSGVKVSTHSGNEYKFTMPASDVTISVVFEAELPFGDVAAEGTFYEAVKFVYENGIMVGTGENNFAPDAKLSRAMVVQVLYNYEKQPEVTVSTDFTDVPEGQWYTSAVRWATDKGVVAGYGDGTFGTDDDVTIEQVAVILWNYAGQPMAEGETVPTESSQWAVNALDWCAKQGILEGIDATDTTVAATRAQTAQILMNFISKTRQ